jgi:hypothetical protein
MNKILESVDSLIKEERGIRKKILDGEDVLKNTERLIAVEAIISAIENIHVHSLSLSSSCINLFTWFCSCYHITSNNLFYMTFV